MKAWAEDGTYYRDFSMEMEMSEEHKGRFIQSACLGFQDISIKTGFNNVLMCAQSKSGSMHICHLLADALGYSNHQIGFNRRGSKAYYPRLLGAKFLGMNTISHCHEKLDLNIHQVIDMLDLKLIVNTRNLLDSLLSRHDRMKVKNPLAILAGYEEYVMADVERQLDTAIELYANEYIRFFAGWNVYDQDIIRTTYEQMLADEVGLVHRVAAELGAAVVGDVEKISKEIREAGGIGYNKGISGRGRKAFNDRQKREIRRRADILGCDNEEFLGGL